MEKQFTISVIIWVHKAEKYLEDTIRSILYQTMDFEQKIQLIIVSGCLGGMSKEIYKKYKVRYPENIIHVCPDEQRSENAKRNGVMENAIGKYINFLDAGSMWSLNAFEEAVDFFEVCGDDIDLISADTEMIEAVKDKHPFNQQLSENKMIDINDRYSDILYRSSTCIMRTETVRNYAFNEQQGGLGDLLLINQVVLRRQKYGMLSSKVIHYCHVKQNNYMISGLDCQKGLKMLFDGIYQESIKRGGCFLPMAQYFIACVLGEFFQQTMVLPADERERHCGDVLAQMLQHIEDRYLLEAGNIDRLVRKGLWAYKYSVDIRDDINQMKVAQMQCQELCHRLDRTNRNYGVLKEWFLLNTQGKRLSDYFDRNGYQNIAVYGMAELGQFFIAELKKTGINVRYGIDRRAEAISAGIPILTLDDELPSVDVVVVTAVYYFSQIVASLQDKLECPVISIEDLLYSLP